MFGRKTSMMANRPMSKSQTGATSKAPQMMPKPQSGGTSKAFMNFEGNPQNVKPFGMKKGGMAKAKMAPSKMGSVKTSSKPDGIAVRGKTKGTMVKMAGGGKAKMMKSGGAC